MSKQGVMVAVDVFSRFFRVQIIKKKYAKDTLQAFKKRLLEKNTPEKIWVDKKKQIMGETKSCGCRESHLISKTYN